MSSEEMSRTEMVVLVQRITGADHASDDETHGRLNKPNRALHAHSERQPDCRTPPGSSAAHHGITGTRSTDCY
jgi:hypothetical protein